jgi:hypothetical protein
MPNGETVVGQPLVASLRLASVTWDPDPDIGERGGPSADVEDGKLFRI